MADPRFYDRRGPFSLAQLAEAAGAQADGFPADLMITDVAPAEAAGPGAICYATGRRAFKALAGQSPAALLLKADELGLAPEGPIRLIVKDPAASFAALCHVFYPAAGRAYGASSGAAIDATARIAPDAVIEHGVVIGPGAEIGAGTRVCAHAVIGRGVAIGRNGFVGPHASICCAYIGDDVVIKAGARIGQEGFGFTPTAKGHLRLPQLGRVIIQDRAEIGAGATVDRGAAGDTVIGEGAKIDNLVQIAHNDQIGRHVILLAQVGLSGSVTVGDWAVLAGKVGSIDHITIGAGARVAGNTGIMRDLEGGQDYAGFVAMPAKDFFKDVAQTLRRLKERKRRDE